VAPFLRALVFDLLYTIPVFIPSPTNPTEVADAQGIPVKCGIRCRGWVMLRIAVAEGEATTRLGKKVRFAEWVLCCHAVLTWESTSDIGRELVAAGRGWRLF
jgi:hypothetical protein